MYPFSRTCGPTGRQQRGMRFRVNNPNVISETIQGETIIIHLTTGTYYSLQGSGAEVWESIAGAASATEIAEDLAARYSISAAEAEAGVVALLDELKREDLVAETSDTARDAAPAPTPATG